MNAKKIGEIIRQKRCEKKMTQEDLARILYVSNKTISKWETGKGIPNIDLLMPLSKTLNISLTELLSGDQDETSEEILLKELKQKQKRYRLNLIMGVILCLCLCFLEVILYIANVEEKYAYLIFGLFIFIFLLFDLYQIINHQKK